jgi:hypothetical protein
MLPHVQDAPKRVPPPDNNRGDSLNGWRAILSICLQVAVCDLEFLNPAELVFRIVISHSYRHATGNSRS